MAEAVLLTGRCDRRRHVMYRVVDTGAGLVVEAPMLAAGRQRGTWTPHRRELADGSAFRYAVTFRKGVWALDGADLKEAREKVAHRAETARLRDRSAEIVEFVRQPPDGARAGEVTAKYGKDAAKYLSRLKDSGRLASPKRGLYLVASSGEGDA